VALVACYRSKHHAVMMYAKYQQQLCPALQHDNRGKLMFVQAMNIYMQGYLCTCATHKTARHDALCRTS
jgi:hypothetical protein